MRCRLSPRIGWRGTSRQENRTDGLCGQMPDLSVLSGRLSYVDRERLERADMPDVLIINLETLFTHLTKTFVLLTLK